MCEVWEIRPLEDRGLSDVCGGVSDADGGFEEGYEQPVFALGRKWVV